MARSRYLSFNFRDKILRFPSKISLSYFNSNSALYGVLLKIQTLARGKWNTFQFYILWRPLLQQPCKSAIKFPFPATICIEIAPRLLFIDMIYKNKIHKCIFRETVILPTNIQLLGGGATSQITHYVSWSVHIAYKRSSEGGNL